MAKQRKRAFRPGFEELPIEKLIGAPLEAVARANSMMAREQASFLLDFCFKKDGDVFEPVMITMSITRGVVTPGTGGGGTSPEVKQVFATFQLPLMTIIPISSLAVESFELDLEMEVTSLLVQESTDENSFGIPSDQEGKDVKLMGSVSRRRRSKAKQSNSEDEHTTAYQREVASSFSLLVKAGSLPLPVGVTSLLDFYTKAMRASEISMQEESAEPDDQNTK